MKELVKLLGFGCLLCVLLTLGACGGSTKGTGGVTVQGRTLDTTGNPLAQILLTILETGASTTTDQNGFFAISTGALQNFNLLVENAQVSSSLEVTDIPSSAKVVTLTIEVDTAMNSSELIDISFDEPADDPVMEDQAPDRDKQDQSQDDSQSDDSSQNDSTSPPKKKDNSDQDEGTSSDDDSGSGDDSGFEGGETPPADDDGIPADPGDQQESGDEEPPGEADPIQHDPPDGGGDDFNGDNPDGGDPGSGVAGGTGGDKGDEGAPALGGGANEF